MKRILLLALLCMSISVEAWAAVEPVHLRQCGESEESPVELQAGILYYVEPMKGKQSRWYSFTAEENGRYTFYSERIKGHAVTKICNKYGEKMFDDGLNLVTGLSTMTAKAGETYSIFMDVYPSDWTFWFGFCSPSEHIELMGAEVREPATCTKDGYMARICAYCGGEGERMTLSAMGHQSGGITTIQPATCLETGIDADTCIHCGTVLSTLVTPITGHKAGAWQNEREATCTGEGYRVQLCTGCGKTMDSQIVPAFGHQASEWKEQPAGCVADGKRYRECTVCGAELERERIPATGHYFEEWCETLEPTTKSAGQESRWCLSCGEYESRIIPKLTLLQGIFGR